MAGSGGQDRLKSASRDLFSVLGEKAIGSLGERVSGLTDRLEGVASGNPAAKAALGSAKSAVKGDNSTTGAMKGVASAIKDKIPGLGGSGGSGSGGGSATKATTIIEEIDVGVPLRVAYNQWTEFGGFPTFMKKVEKVETEQDEKLEWKAQIFWSHRTWEATILEQVPDERIVWRSKGQKGHVDGSVTFHELSPNLTRILVVLEYYPQGLFERTGNLWRAQGRRARVELNHFKRHVMTRTILDPDAVEGWRGTIEDGEVVESHEDAIEREEQEDQDSGSEEPEDAEDEPDEDSDEDSDEYEESDEDSDEYEEPDEDEPDEDSDEYEEPDEDSDEYEEEPDEDSDEYEDEPDEDEPDEDSDEDEEPDEDSDEYEDEPDEDSDEYDEPDEDSDEYEEPDEERPARSRRRRARAS